ncbi:MAG: ADOP family duplicated permease [Gemmatimonadota bacterium]
MLRSMLVRLRALIHRPAAEADLEEEIAYHLERDAARYRARGSHPGAAGLAARRDFGRVDDVKDTVRDSWGLRRLGELRQDVVFALRGFRRAPVFVLVVVLTIALGLGLNGTAFTIFNTYVLRAAPVRDPGSLYELRWHGQMEDRAQFSWTRYEELRRDHRIFTETFAYGWLSAPIGRQSAVGQLVTGNYFRLLGVGAALGRTLVPDDDGGAPIVVLSHRTWRTRFAGDPGIVGTRILIRGYPVEVAGIAREGFDGLEDTPPDYWAPLATASLLDRRLDLRDSARTVEIVGRLRHGLGVEQAQAALSPWIRHATEERPPAERATGVTLHSRATAIQFSPEVLLALTPIIVAFGLVLLIACANVANIMLARGIARQREIGIRLAMGAGRERLIRQLLTESVLLALPAAALGFLLARLTLGAGVRLMFASLPAEFVPFVKVLPLAADHRVIVFMLLGAVVAAVLFGLAPALQATRPGIVQATRGDFDSGLKPSRLRTVLIVGQIAASTLLLVSAGVLVRGQRQLQRLDLGLDPTGVIALEVNESFRPQAVARLAARSDVRSVAAASNPPLEGRFPPAAIATETDSAVVDARFGRVSRDYFAVLGVSVARGRTFSTAEEGSLTPVAIVNDAVVRRMWPGRDPIGQVVHLSTVAWWARQTLAPFGVVRIIGVVHNTATGWIGDGIDAPIVYLPTNLTIAGTRLLVRTSGSADRALVSIRADLELLGAGALDESHTVEESLESNLYPFRAANWISSAVGGIALLLTLTGVYGVLSYLVTQRKREIGIRLALGAAAHAVVGLVLRQSVRLAAVGIGIGLALALGASKLFSYALVTIDAFEPVAYGAGVLAVALACVAAAYVPSRRAARVDPLEALKD